MKVITRSAAYLALLFSVSVQADEQSDLPPLQQGFYVAPMYSYIDPDKHRNLDFDSGGTLALGYRASPDFALELYGVFATLDNEIANTSASEMTGGGISALAFIGGADFGFYLPFGIGYLKTDPQGATDEVYKGLTLDAGLGYMLPLSFGRYQFAIRTEARYRHHNGQDGRKLDEEASGMQDLVFNLGLQLPFGFVPPQPLPASAPVEVAPLDTDGDGVNDASDLCPGTPEGQNVDATGCPPPPPPPVCPETLEAEGQLLLEGCDAGDIIVLRGVLFATDESDLDARSKGILDSVATALISRPAVRVEIGGHTDSQGSSQHNARLSEQRAQTAQAYLISKGVEKERLTVRGYGDNQPYASNETAADRALNRRVELKVIESGDQ